MAHDVSPTTATCIVDAVLVRGIAIGRDCTNLHQVSRESHRHQNCASSVDRRSNDQHEKMPAESVWERVSLIPKLGLQARIVPVEKEDLPAFKRRRLSNCKIGFSATGLSKARQSRWRGLPEASANTTDRTELFVRPPCDLARLVDFFVSTIDPVRSCDIRAVCSWATIAFCDVTRRDLVCCPKDTKRLSQTSPSQTNKRNITP